MKQKNNVRNFREMMLGHEEEMDRMEVAVQVKLADEAYQMYLDNEQFDDDGTNMYTPPRRAGGMMSELDECETEMLRYMRDTCSGSCTKQHRAAFDSNHPKWATDPSRLADAILNGLVKRGIVSYDLTTDVYTLSDLARRDLNDLDFNK